MPDTALVNITATKGNRGDIPDQLVEDINVHVGAIVQLLIGAEFSQDDVTYNIDINDQTQAQGTGTDYDPDPDPEPES